MNSRRLDVSGLLQNGLPVSLLYILVSLRLPDHKESIKIHTR